MQNIDLLMVTTITLFNIKVRNISFFLNYHYCLFVTGNALPEKCHDDLFKTTNDNVEALF
jgi:hypothetical protein